MKEPCWSGAVAGDKRGIAEIFEKDWFVSAQHAVSKYGGAVHLNFVALPQCTTCDIGRKSTVYAELGGDERIVRLPGAICQ